jgi:hypothetical protein
MMMNGGIGKLVSDAQSSTIVAAVAEKTREAQVDTLYLSYLSRHPRADEMAKVNKALSNGLGLTELAWVLANTREFLFVQ